MKLVRTGKSQERSPLLLSHNQLEVREFFLYLLTANEKKGRFSSWKKVHALIGMNRAMIYNVISKKINQICYYLTNLKDISECHVWDPTTLAKSVQIVPKKSR